MVRGCVRISKRAAKHGSICHYLTISVNQKRREPIDRLHELFGGAVHEGRNKYGPMYQWYTTSRKAADILREMRPYMLVKGPEVDLALEFQERRAPRGGIRGSGIRGGQAVDPERDAQDHSSLQTLKRRVD